MFEEGRDFWDSKTLLNFLLYVCTFIRDNTENIDTRVDIMVRYLFIVSINPKINAKIGVEKNLN